MAQQESLSGVGPVLYDLFAVCNHYGRMGYGHYTCAARNDDLFWDDPQGSAEAGTGTGDPHWAYYDDDDVRACRASEVVTAAAYTLLYRRRHALP